MSLFTLALVLAAGLAGPLLATPKRFRAPVVIGEIAFGVVLGDPRSRQPGPTLSTGGDSRRDTS